MASAASHAHTASSAAVARGTNTSSAALELAPQRAEQPSPAPSYAAHDAASELYAQLSEQDSASAHSYESQVTGTYAGSAQGWQSQAGEPEARDYASQVAAIAHERYASEAQSARAASARINQAYQLDELHEAEGQYEHTPAGSWRRNARGVLEPRPTTMRALKRRSWTGPITAAVVVAAIVLGYSAARIQSWREKHALQLTAASAELARTPGAAAASASPLPQTKPLAAEPAHVVDQPLAAEPSEAAARTPRAADSSTRTHNPHARRGASSAQERLFAAAQPEPAATAAAAKPSERDTRTAAALMQMPPAPEDRASAHGAPGREEGASAALGSSSTRVSSAVSPATGALGREAGPSAALPSSENGALAREATATAALASATNETFGREARAPSTSALPENEAFGREARTASTSGSPANDARGREAAAVAAFTSSAANAARASSPATDASRREATSTSSAATPATSARSSSTMNDALDRAAQSAAAPAGDSALAMVDEVTRTSAATRAAQPVTPPPSASAQAAGPQPVLTIRPLDPASPEASLPGTPAQPSRDQVRDAILAIEPQLALCAGNKHGTSHANVTIQNNGRVSYSLIDGAFAGTEAGSCMARALRAAIFPSFAGPPFKVRYPLVF